MAFSTNCCVDSWGEVDHETIFQMSVWVNVISGRFRLVPFLTELRAVMDWVWTDTTLSLSSWICVEDIYAHIFILKCWRESEKVKSQWKCLLPACCSPPQVCHQINVDAAYFVTKQMEAGNKTYHWAKHTALIPNPLGLEVLKSICSCQQQHADVFFLWQ